MVLIFNNTNALGFAENEEEEEENTNKNVTFY